MEPTIEDKVEKTALVETAASKGGPAQKRKHTNERAMALEVPCCGNGMTVQPFRPGTTVDTTQEPPLKKRQKQEAKHDPMAMLSDELCMKIMEFLCQTCDDVPLSAGVFSFSWLRKSVGRKHARLRSVSTIWKAAFDRIPWRKYAGLVEISLKNSRLLNYGSTHLSAMKDWLCLHNIQIGALAIYYNRDDATLKVDLLSIAELIKECNTQNMRVLCFKVTRPRESGLTANFGQELKTLHDTIAMNCPSLEILDTNLILPMTTPIYTKYVSSPLFSMSSLKELRIDLAYFADDNKAVDPTKGETRIQIDCNVLSKLIRNLPNLKSLCVYPARQDEIKKRRFHVESKSLKFLQVVDLSMHISFDCPRLRHFEYYGGPKGVCILPPMTPNQFEDLMQLPDEDLLKVRVRRERLDSIVDWRGGDRWRAHLASFHLWRQRGKNNLKRFRAYVEEGLARERARRAAIFETFDEEEDPGAASSQLQV